MALRSVFTGTKGIARGALAAALAVLVVGCSQINVREELGMIRQGPDPFTVVPNRALEMPSDMSELPTPTPGAASRVEPRPEEDAQVALIGAPASFTDNQSAAEQALLRGAGADAASDDIRALLAEDAEVSEDDWRVLDSLLGSEPNADPLDARTEAERLAADNPTVLIPVAPAEE